jgi:hypothetical protein
MRLGVRLSEGRDGDQLLHTHSWRLSFHVKHSGLNDEAVRAESCSAAVAA